MCCRIIRVRLRFQQSNLQQKDSVYIEFEKSADADAAVASPPLQLGSYSERLECLHKRDYEQQQRSFPQTSSLATSTGKRKQGSADSVEDNAADLTEDQEQSRKRKKLSAAQAKQIDDLQAALKQEQAQIEHLREAAKKVSNAARKPVDALPVGTVAGGPHRDQHHLMSSVHCRLSNKQQMLMPEKS